VRTAALALSAFLLASALTAGRSAIADDQSAPFQQTLDGLVPGLLAERHVPGAAVAVVDAGRTLVRGYGQRRAKSPEPVGPETVFEAASLGKPVFAYAIMLRVADGRLDLDRPLSESLDAPFAEDSDRLWRITARHVLAHTTGFPNWRPRRFSDPPGTLVILREPGSAFGYSGEGYMYLQAVVERRSGETLERLMQESLLSPLGMTRSSYLWSDAFEADFAQPHGYWGQAGKKWRGRRAGVAFSLHATAADLARFLEAMLARDNLVAEAMLVPQVEPAYGEGLAWSLGWGLERRPEGDWFWQWGDNEGFEHFVIGSRPEGRAVLVLTNGDRGARVYRTVVEAVLEFRPRSFEWIASD